MTKKRITGDKPTEPDYIDGVVAEYSRGLDGPVAYARDINAIKPQQLAPKKRRVEEDSAS